jgi:hypothetical protein
VISVTTHNRGALAPATGLMESSSTHCLKTGLNLPAVLGCNLLEATATTKCVTHKLDYYSVVVSRLSVTTPPLRLHPKLAGGAQMLNQLTGTARGNKSMML